MNKQTIITILLALVPIHLYRMISHTPLTITPQSF
jgi:hypothetical protein